MSAEVLESDEKPPERYRRLFIELELGRKSEGGTLSQAEEARRTDELDQVWWTMTDQEQHDYERALARTIARVWRRGKVVRLPPQPRGKSGAIGWLRGLLLLPRWLVLLAWLLHFVLTFLLGRMM